MASGRLASVRVNTGNAAKLYTNNSGKTVAASLVATSLSKTANADLSICVDTEGSAVLNYVVNDRIIASGGGNKKTIVYDGSGAVGFNNGDTSWHANYGSRMRYETSSGWAAGGSSNHFHNHYLRVDPYYLTNPEEYGRSSPEAAILDSSSVYYHKSIDKGSIGESYKHLYTTGSTGSSFSRSLGYYNRGFIFDPYTSENAHMIAVSVNDNSYMSMTWIESSGDTSWTGDKSRTSDSMIYQNSGGGHNPSSYSHPWYAGMMWLEKGVLCTQSSHSGSSDQVRFSNSRKSGYAFSNNYFIYHNESTSYSITRVSSYGIDNPIGWFKYNPNNDKYYLMIRGGSYEGIHELTLDALEGGSKSASSFGTKVANIPHAKMATPVRIDKELWYSVDDSGEGWFTPDFISWTKTGDYLAQFTSDSSVLQMSKYSSGHKVFLQPNGQLYYSMTGFTDLNQSGILEYQTTTGNYERTGLVLSPGDSIYVENSTEGEAPMAVTLMGFEDD